MPPQSTPARRTILIVTVLVAAAGFAACGSEEPEGAPAGERSADTEPEVSVHPEIAFSRGTGGSSAGIYVMNADGSGQTRLTDTRNVDLDPAFSSDGERIAFARIEGKASDVYVMNADGSGQTNLTDSPASIDAAPAFSPDGQKIAFTSSRDSPRPRGGPSLIYVMNADGTAVTRLTDGPDDTQPAWSPDGRRIVFNRAQPLEDDPSSASRGDIYAIGADGSGERNLTGEAAFGAIAPTSPTFSPDGERIAFLALEEGSTSRVVWTMDADGSDAGPLRERPLTRLSFSRPAFSPDGGRIAFVGEHGGISVMNADGSDQTPLTNKRLDSGPAWSPASDASP